MKWIEKQRADFIFSKLAEGGVRRRDLTDQFDISVSRASYVLQWFQREYPDAMVYSLSVKSYLPGPNLEHHHRRHIAETDQPVKK